MSETLRHAALEVATRPMVFGYDGDDFPEPHMELAEPAPRFDDEGSSLLRWLMAGVAVVGGFLVFISFVLRRL